MVAVDAGRPLRRRRLGRGGAVVRRGRAPRAGTSCRRRRSSSPAQPPSRGARPPRRSRYRARAHAFVPDPCRKSHGGSPPTSRASGSRSTTSRSTSSGARRSSGRSPRRCARVPYGETVTYGELAALAGRPQAPRAAGSFCAQNRLPLIVPCHRVVAAGGLGGYGSLGVEYKRRLLELEACRSLTTSGASSPRSRRGGDCDRLAELSGLFHTAGSLHLRGRGEFSVHLDLAEAAVARRAFGLLRSFGVEAEIRTYRRRAFDRATRYQLHVPGGDALARGAAPGGRARRPPTRRSRRRRSGSSAARAAAAPTCAARCSAAARSAGPRAPHLEIRTREPRGRRPARHASPPRTTSPLRVHDRGAARGRLREGRRGDRRRARAGRRGRRRAGARRARGRRRGASAREPDRERRPREPRPRQPRRPCQSRRSASSRPGRLGTSRTVAARDRRASAAPSVASLRELAAKCRPPATKAAAHRRLGRSRCPRGRRRRRSFWRVGWVILGAGGSALVRRWIQTPSAGSVLSAVQPEGRVVLGASPPARRTSAAELRSAADRAQG